MNLIYDRALRFLVVLGAMGSSAGAQQTQLSNFSVRAEVGASAPFIAGFTLTGDATKTVLVRAIGPALSAFGVMNALPDPKLELFDGNGTKITENDNFNDSDAAVFASVGAFVLDTGAKDAALVAALRPGNYTAHVTGPGGGVALVEVYDVSGGATRLTNVSTLAMVGRQGAILIPGFTVAAGSGTRRMLLRAAGPALVEPFGRNDRLANPKIELYAGGTKIAENDDWGHPWVWWRRIVPPC